MAGAPAKAEVAESVERLRGRGVRRTPARQWVLEVLAAMRATSARSRSTGA